MLLFLLLSSRSPFAETKDNCFVNGVSGDWTAVSYPLVGNEHCPPQGMYYSVIGLVALLIIATT